MSQPAQRLTRQLFYFVEVEKIKIMHNWLDFVSIIKETKYLSYPGNVMQYNLSLNDDVIPGYTQLLCLNFFDLQYTLPKGSDLNIR